ncbi:hypothetical protein [Bdellovibrio bacteriovorus]|uniref:hypothetical protein n=1 Tax=Bdellovibrio TaxID=958 RepID=UPI0035A93FF6
MMRPSHLKYLFTVTLVLFITARAQATSLTTVNKSCICNAEVMDSLEEPQSFNYGKFQGQCIDSCRFRAARILEKSPALSVGNILHLGSYYKATIPWEHFAKIEMGFEEFLPGISHVLLRFTLDEKAPSIKLVNQTDLTKSPIEVRSLVISSEGVPPKDHKYSLLESYFGHYLLAHRLVTGQELDRWIAEYKHPLKFVELQVNKESIGKIFLQGVQESDAKRLQNIYALFSNNCSTSAFSFIDSEVKASRTSWERFEEALPIAGPIGTLRSLFNRNLAKPEL